MIDFSGVVPTYYSRISRWTGFTDASFIKPEDSPVSLFKAILYSVPQVRGIVKLEVLATGL